MIEIYTVIKIIIINYILINIMNAMFSTKIKSTYIQVTNGKLS